MNANDVDIKPPEEPKVICAWCLSERGEKAPPGVTHGICQEHLDKVRSQFHRNMEAAKGAAA